MQLILYPEKEKPPADSILLNGSRLDADVPVCLFAFGLFAMFGLRTTEP